MPNYPRPKSSMPKKPDKSSLHPHGFPTFAETVEGLKQGLSQLGSHLIGAGAGIVGNLIGPLTNMKKSAQEGDEDAEMAYEEALAMLRSSGSSAAESMLRDLGEALGEEEESEEPSRDILEPTGDDVDLGSMRVSPAAHERTSEEGESALSAQKSAQKGKTVCLECGAELKKLTHTHLSKHGLNPQEYKKKHGLATSIS